MQRHRSIFGRALGASLVLHLLLLFVIVPSAHKVWPVSLSAEPIFETEKPAAQEAQPLEFEIVESPDGSEQASAADVAPPPPSEFELYELANSREEVPSSDRAPLSDLDRRAHGGVGEPGATSPASVGNTTQLVQAVGGDRLGSGAPSELAAQPERERRQQAGGAAAPEPAPLEPTVEESRDIAQPTEDELAGEGGTTQQLRPPTRQVPPPAEPRAPTDGATDQEPAVPRDGAGEDDESQPASDQPRLTLPPNDSWALPPGEGGMPENPDRGGGEVDEGGLSFDTQWYEWGPYAAKMLRAIRRNWQIPEIARLGVSGVVRIRFFIERSGEVTGLTITDESGRPPMDFAARDAIVDSSPFDPLPSDLFGVDREGVTITFYYNARPPGR